jgi:probable blue pigment (indigoidine) exporter
VTHPDTPRARASLATIGPALLGASSFACADVLSKVTLRAGTDVLTMSMARGFIGLAVMFAWLRFTQKPVPLTRRETWISLGLGIVFGANVFLVFKAVENIPVPIAILTYFVYPLLTGIVGAATGLDKLTWRGAAAAITAFLGLALMIGVHPGGLAIIGVLAALAAACCRVALLLITRAALQGADARMITWYSLVSSTALFAVAALVTMNWQPPATLTGWISLIVLGIAVTTGILGVFASTVRIGPFHTALFMNLEPLLVTIGSALVLHELITPLQALGGAVMIAALVAFQLRR